MKQRLLRIGIYFGIVLAVLSGTNGIPLSKMFSQQATALTVGDLTVNWGVPDGQPIFTVSNMAPGQAEDRTVVITNGATTPRPIGVRGIETADPDNLGSVLLIEIYSGNTLVYGPKTLDAFFSESNLDSIQLMTLNSNTSTDFTFRVIFDENAGNAFQNADEVVFDLQIGLAIDIPQECSAIAFDFENNPPIFGTQRSDSLKGTNGNDLIFALEGSDKVDGKDGNDCIVGGDGSDSLSGSKGNDIVLGGAGSDTLEGGDGQDVLYGQAGSDSIKGGKDNDQLRGGAGSDSVHGEQGTDSCEGESKKTCEINL